MKGEKSVERRGLGRASRVFLVVAGLAFWVFVYFSADLDLSLNRGDALYIIGAMLIGVICIFVGIFPKPRRRDK
jgi:hypothetical protein